MRRQLHHFTGHNRSNRPYNENMARGWESKSVEEQQMATIPQGPQLYSGNGIESEESRRREELRRAERERKRQSLNLQREHILSQRTSNPGRRAALEAALAQIEASIEALG
jgi:hypothetical protein